MPHRAVCGDDELVEVDPTVAVLVEPGEDQVRHRFAVILRPNYGTYGRW